MLCRPTQQAAIMRLLKNQLSLSFGNHMSDFRSGSRSQQIGTPGDQQTQHITWSFAKIESIMIKDYCQDSSISANRC
jgi:hypothetical protein